MSSYINTPCKHGWMCLAALLTLWVAGCGGEITSLDRLADGPADTLGKAKPKPKPTLDDQLRLQDGPEETLSLLRQAGARVTLDESLPERPVVGINFEVANVTERIVSYLDRFPSLEEVLLIKKPVNDAGLQHLAKLTNLKRLSLSGCVGITDDGLAHLAALSSLTDLDLSSTKVGDEGLPHLTGLALSKLNLGSTSVSDAGAEHVKQIATLEVLDLDRTQVTDQGMVHVAGLGRLRSLKLRRTQLTNEGLAHLVGLKQLESLDVQNTEVNDAGVQALRKEIPRLKVSY